MESLISKKELLKLTQISYGQLYRWKRMRVIPEEWFIRKSSPTGQETYFERDKILDRIEFILSQKDKASLDEIAAMLNKKDSRYLFPSAQDISEDVIGGYAKDIFYSLYEKNQPVGGQELLILHLIQTYLVKSMITMDELKIVISVLEEQYDMLMANEGKLYLMRKMGIPFVLCSIHSEMLYTEKAIVNVLEVAVPEVVDLLKAKVGKE